MRRTISLTLAALMMGALTFGAGAARAQDVSELIPTCMGCHGENGIPEADDVPIIWGQHFYYLYVQLKDYQAGRRANQIMSEIAAGLSKEQMQALAQHFAEQPWPAIGFRSSAEDSAKGETATAAGQCVQCHLGGYEGNSRVPRLSGQKPTYLERTMLDFKHKRRMNAPAKSSLLVSYEESDITAMANFLAGF